MELALPGGGHHPQVGTVLHGERDAQRITDGEGGLLLQTVVKGRGCALRECLSRNDRTLLNKRTEIVKKIIFYFVSKLVNNRLVCGT